MEPRPPVSFDFVICLLQSYLFSIKIMFNTQYFNYELSLHNTTLSITVFITWNKEPRNTVIVMSHSLLCFICKGTMIEGLVVNVTPDGRTVQYCLLGSGLSSSTIKSTAVS